MKRKGLPAGTVDFHTHILPSVDHGSRSIEMSCEQWRLLSDAGLSAVVATPHFYAHEEASVRKFLARRDAAAKKLLDKVGTDGPALYLGAEVLVFPGLEALPELRELCIGGGEILLLEMPLGGWSQECLDTVYAIADMGILPLFAHIDRYPRRAIRTILEGSSFRFQVNVAALCGLSPVAFWLRRMLRMGEISALGSDLHGIPRGGYDHYHCAFLKLEKDLSAVNAKAGELLRNASPFRGSCE